MSKQKASKLDHYGERLDEWFGVQKKTLQEVQEELRLDGCSVSLSRLSDWWSDRQKFLQEERMLSQIASGARQAKGINEQFEKFGWAEFEMLARLQQTLTFKLSTEANVDPDKLELVNRMMKEVIKIERLKQLKEQISLDRDKFQFDAAKACLTALPELKAISSDNGLSEPQKVEQIRLRLFGVAAGKETTDH